jgi:hypothetical protein
MHRFFHTLFGSVFAMLTLSCSGAVGAPPSTQAASATAYSGPCIMSPIPPDAPLYHVAGRVIDDASGLPVAGATVSLDSLCGMSGTTGRRQEDHFHLQIVTDQGGKFAFDKIPVMAVSLSATRDNYLQTFAFRRKADDPIGSFMVGPNTDPITLRIAPAASISGIVRDQDGAPMPDAWITLQCFHTWSGWRRLEYCNTVKTEANGFYRFGPLQPGRYFLVAQPWLHTEDPPARGANGTAVGYVPVRAPLLAGEGSDTFLELAEGQQANVDFQFHREVLHHVTGRISGAGKWPPLVDIVDRDGSKSYFVKSFFFVTTPGACCEFESWVPSGNFRVVSDFHNAEGKFVGSSPLQVADTDVSEVVFPLTRHESINIPIEISNAPGDTGSRTCGDSVAACGFWYLQLVALKPNGYVEAGPQSSMSGGMQVKGAYRSEDVTVDPGTYAVAVATTANVYAHSITSGAVNLIREPLVVQPNNPPDTIRIVLSEAAAVEGITRYGGEPVSAWVYGIPEQPDARLFQPILSGSDGKFRLEGLAPLPYLFFATNVELSPDIHDPKVLDYWRQRAQERVLKAGSATQVELQVSVIP